MAPVRGYHAYMDQWEAEIDTALFFKRELGEYADVIKGTYAFSYAELLANPFAVDWHRLCNTRNRYWASMDKRSKAIKEQRQRHMAH